MFCDMADSTGHQFRMEPERFATILRNYRQIVFDRAYRHGGYVARVVGDGVLVFFGWPSATGKDAPAAVACALDVAARMKRGIDAIPISARLAVETGWVLVGDLNTANAPRGEIEHATVVGSAANIAARLQQLAHLNGVIVGEGTLALLGDRFIVDPVDTSAVNLPFPIRAAHALADAGDGNPLGWLMRRFAHFGATLTGREDLLGALRTRWDTAKGGAGQAVLLTGDAGIGKSHMLAALLHSVARDQPEVVYLFCAPSSRDRSFQPVIDWLRRATGVETDAFPDEIRLRVAEYANRLGLDEAAAGVLGSLLGVAAVGQRPPEQLRRLMFQVLLDILLRSSEDRPLMILVEDLHWADPSTVELLNQIADTVGDRRILLVVTDRNPNNGILPHATHFPIAPLDAAGARELAQSAARRFDVQLTDAEQAAIAERSEGVALFIEEFVRSVADPEPASRRPPGSIGQLLASRLDTLGSARPLALMASVVGREVPVGLLAELADMAGDAFESALDRLTGSDVMVKGGTGNMPVLTFRHALLTDAAYGAMQQPERRSLHLRVARILRRDSPALATTAPALLGHHLAEAGEIQEAAPLFRSAARGMLDIGAYAEAEGHARRSLGLYEGFAGNEDILGALMPLGEALIGGRGYADPNVQQVYERGARLAMELGTAGALLAPLRGLTSYYQVRGPISRARDLGAQVLKIAGIVGDPTAICQAEQRQGWCLQCQGRLIDAAASMSSALARHRGLDPAIRMSNYEDGSILAHLAWVEWLIDGPEAMQQRASAALARIDGAPPLRAAYVRGVVAFAHQAAGEPEPVARLAAESEAIAQEYGIVYWIAVAGALSGWAAVARGDRAGLECLRAAVAAYDRTQGQVMLPYLLGLLAEAEVWSGGREEASAALDRADAVVSGIGVALYRAPLLRLRSRLLSGAERDACLEEARSVALAQGAAAFARVIDAEWESGPPVVAVSEALAMS